MQILKELVPSDALVHVANHRTDFHFPQINFAKSEILHSAGAGKGDTEMEAVIEIDVRVDQIELRNMRPVLSLDKTYEKAVAVSGQCIITHPFSITVNDDVDLVRLPGLVVLQGTDRFTEPMSDENGRMLGFIRYDEEIKASAGFEGSPARFVIEIFGFDLNLLASFVPAIRPQDKLQLILTVFELERSSMPDGWCWPATTVQDSGAIPVYDVAVKIASQE